MGAFTSEDESADYDDDEPMTLTELRDSIRTRASLYDPVVMDDSWPT